MAFKFPDLSETKKRLEEAEANLQEFYQKQILDRDLTNPSLTPNNSRHEKDFLLQKTTPEGTQIHLNGSITSHLVHPNRGFLQYQFFVQDKDYNPIAEISKGMGLTGDDIELDPTQEHPFGKLEKAIKELEAGKIKEAKEILQQVKNSHSDIEIKTFKVSLPFSEKDRAKAIHGKKLTWNPDQKSWYYTGKELPKDLQPAKKPKKGPEPEM